MKRERCVHWPSPREHRLLALFSSNPDVLDPKLAQIPEQKDRQRDQSADANDKKQLEQNNGKEKVGLPKQESADTRQRIDAIDPESPDRQKKLLDALKGGRVSRVEAAEKRVKSEQAFIEGTTKDLRETEKAMKNNERADAAGNTVAKIATVGMAPEAHTDTLDRTKTEVAASQTQAEVESGATKDAAQLTEEAKIDAGKKAEGRTEKAKA